MSREQFLQIVYYDPELDPVLNEIIEILDAQLSQLNSNKFLKFDTTTSPTAYTKQQQIPIPEYLNNENDSDNPVDIVFSIRRNITLQIPHRLTRDQEIYENNRSSFNRDQSNDAYIIIIVEQ